ncbi:nucleotidyltransferase domain-containing protein [Candidatus Ruminimicrobiellum ovillum]|uniref:nucleotidyltransferase domain-containing protein n=1 Tax=Candidatus Ruminimicrobiellum ovillum TaxID=1947927 RepID=UPI00355A62B3
MIDTSKVLTKILEEIDISDTLYKKAVDKYTAVSNWLNSDNSSLKKYGIDIYPQGSFRLGTVVKPISDKDDYDIDLVCCLNNNIENLYPQDVKRIVGNRLKENEKYKNMLQEEGKRCWTLEYSEQENFHIDVLPAITNSIQNGERYFQSINITDKTKPGYWFESNPKGFASWFENRQRKILDEYIKKYAYSIDSSVENVPSIQTYNMKTPLRQVVKLLKRHRDIMFKDNDDKKPASIIVTTLAAKAYNGDGNLLIALKNIVYKMKELIQVRENGNIVINNPINEYENFADRCNLNNAQADLFAWIDKLNQDFIRLDSEINFNSEEKFLSNLFGLSVINKVANKISTASHSSININIKPNKPWGNG